MTGVVIEPPFLVKVDADDLVMWEIPSAAPDNPCAAALSQIQLASRKSMATCHAQNKMFTS
jgi:hypothetical protein